jgi:hypothetical protein
VAVEAAGAQPQEGAHADRSVEEVAGASEHVARAVVEALQATGMAAVPAH